MSSFLLPSSSHHRHDLDNAGQLQLSRRAAERFAVLEAVREQRHRQSGTLRLGLGDRFRGLLTARSRRGTTPA